MSEQKHKGLAPELRFPDFKDKGEWEEAKLGENNISTFVKERIPLEQVSLENYVSTENLLPDYAGVTKASKLPSTGSFTRYKKGDILVSNIRPYLKKVWAATKEGGTSNDVIVIRAKSKVKDSFLKYLLRNDEFINYVMKGAKGVKMPRGDISLMKEYPVAIPSNPKEQQKIADCLTSIDELITAQAQKLDALKAHKKGLMQQIFPAEGETVPKLRFPEFRDKGEWVQDVFDTLVDVVDGDRGTNYPKAEEFSESGFCLFLSAKNVTKNGFRFDEFQFITKEKDKSLRKGKLKRKDVVLTTRGSIGQFAYFTNNVPYENIRINSGMVILRVKSKKLVSDYLYAFSNSAPLTTHIENVAFGNAQQQLTVAGIKKFPIYYPEPEEQQKIANCLTSVDELIAAQAQKLDALKAHKKGLMQQLFPAMDEATS